MTPPPHIQQTHLPVLTYTIPTVTTTMAMSIGQRLQAFLSSFLVVWLLVGETRAVRGGQIPPHVESFDDVTVFQTKVAENDAVWMITFYSSASDSQSAEKLLPEISKAASITRGVFHFGAVDVSTDGGNEIADKYTIVRATSSLPSIYIFSDEAKPQKYTGKKTTQEILNKMVQTGIETIQTRAGGAPGNSGGGPGSSKSSSTGPSKVVHLTSSNFQEKVLDSPLVSAVACKYIHNHTMVKPSIPHSMS